MPRLLRLLMQGITGFGSAIINLLVWAACTAVGINAGASFLCLTYDERQIASRMMHGT